MPVEEVHPGVRFRWPGYQIAGLVTTESASASASADLVWPAVDVTGTMTTFPLEAQASGLFGFGAFQFSGAITTTSGRRRAHA